MSLYIKPMTPKFAIAIAKWHYAEPYSVYDLGDDPEVIDELLNGSFYSVINIEEELVGFFCFGAVAQVPGGHFLGLYSGPDTIDIGLGCRPDLTGQGFGLEFVKAGLRFAKEQFQPRRFRLSVATFNKRAIRVYEKAGFTPGPTFMSKTPTGEREFLLMTANVSL